MVAMNRGNWIYGIRIKFNAKVTIAPIMEMCADFGLVLILYQTEKVGVNSKKEIHTIPLTPLLPIFLIVE
jgi:hypothetical protein